MGWKKIDRKSKSIYTDAYPVKVGLLSFDVFGYPRSREINDLVIWLKGIKLGSNKVVLEYNTLDEAYEFLSKQVKWNGIIWEKFETGPDEVTFVTIPIKGGIGFQGPYKMITQ
jgi:hypothetical protein